MTAPLYCQRGFSFVTPSVQSNAAVAIGEPEISTSAITYWVRWPSWAPKQVFLTSFLVGHQSQTPPYGQFAISLDPGRVAFNSGSPPGSQLQANGLPVDWSMTMDLCTLFTGTNEPGAERNNLVYPVYFDVTQDIIILEQDGATDQWWMQIWFLVPTPTGAGVLAFPTGWAAIAAAGLNADSGSLSDGENHIIVIQPSAFSQSLPGSQTQVVFQAANASAMTIDRAFVGPLAAGSAYTASTLTQLTFSGAPNIVVPAGSQLVSDPLPAGISFSAGMVVSYHASAGAGRYVTTQAGWTGYYLVGPDVSGTPQSSGFTQGSACLGVASIEQLYST